MLSISEFSVISTKFSSAIASTGDSISSLSIVSSSLLVSASKLPSDGRSSPSVSSSKVISASVEVSAVTPSSTFGSLSSISEALETLCAPSTTDVEINTASNFLFIISPNYL